MRTASERKAALVPRFVEVVEATSPVELDETRLDRCADEYRVELGFTSED